MKDEEAREKSKEFKEFRRNDMNLLKKMMILSAIAVTTLFAQAATETVNGIEWTYEVVDGEAIVVYIPSSTSGEIEIPSTLGNYPVTTIRECAFYECRFITSVTLPNTVTNIGEYAFCNCRLLESVVIPSSIVNFGKDAFYGCKPKNLTVPGRKCGIDFSSVTNLVISDGTEVIEDYAFAWCSSLVNVTISDSVTIIGNKAFRGCGNLTSVTIGCNVTRIGDSAFYNCKDLLSVKIPDSVTSIEHSVFYDCRSLSSVKIGNNVTNIGGSAFYHCNNSLYDRTTIPHVKLVDGWVIEDEASLSGDLNLTGIRGIGDCAFFWSDNLMSVTIPDGVKRIGKRAFYECSSLTSMVIPNSVTSIGDEAFYGCKLKNVTVPGWKCGIDFSSVTNLVISDGTTSIRQSAFYNCSTLVRVRIPNSVTSIGSDAFNRCNDLLYDRTTDRKSVV